MSTFGFLFSSLCFLGNFCRLIDFCCYVFDTCCLHRFPAQSLLDCWRFFRSLFQPLSFYFSVSIYRWLPFVPSPFPFRWTPQIDWFCCSKVVCVLNHWKRTPHIERVDEIDKEVGRSSNAARRSWCSLSLFIHRLLLLHVYFPPSTLIDLFSVIIDIFELLRLSFT